ncbi:class 1 fructose-bisphosphatase [Azorhizobium doebereinerae]|uniref:class 1 fructose-bisphosphatase n=1 Tax=Azorhizobium doebereinerae TaxID=281091 RepID=UPI00040C6827|nr:class 1 fructose-bisphosphatase [Azorhizobium doebereinerae]
MVTSVTLDDVLDGLALRNGRQGEAVAATVRALAAAAIGLADLIGAGPLSGPLGAVRGEAASGDIQKQLDVEADALVTAALRGAPVAVVGSEEMDAPLVLDPGAPLAVAIDPLDGSSNIDTNAPVGTIFSLLPMPQEAGALPVCAFQQSGRRQLAAGFFIYGPQTALVLTLGEGTQAFTLDRTCGVFRMTAHRLKVPEETREFAINASNRRHWDEAVQLYVQDCQQGRDGPRGSDFNMRWIASMVAEAYRILVRGGVYLYPADARQGYHQGRLRLVYEAHPVAFLMEQAGASATDGRVSILDLAATSLHQRVPLVFGSVGEVRRVARYHTTPSALPERAPLFGARGLFRA